MKRIVGLLLLVCCTAFSQVQPTAVPTGDASCCCDQCNCGPDCAPPPTLPNFPAARIAATTAESKTAIARQSERRNVRPEPRTPRLAEVLSPPITSWVEGWLADGVPVYRRHCALLI